jgi:type II secretory ATPase GspE/PulE/Tfp pilus assembly ATPase PilB-like protein
MVDIVQALNQIIIDSFSQNSSDIHIEPVFGKYRIRNRIDGQLYDYLEHDYIVGQQIINRIKILCHLDISQKNLPQDGKFVFNVAQNIFDIRASIFPTVDGQKVVLRILLTYKQESLANLGMPSELVSHVSNFLNLKEGFILATGPTGSGKTTTLYGMLNYLSHLSKNIVSLEDPVEYKIPGVFQTNINKNIGLDFQFGIANLLRQDPDIIMIGEIRDKNTAQIAVESALTGHLVLSSLHTKDSSSSLLRLLQLGIDSIFLSSSLKAIISQRLVRKLCSCFILLQAQENDKVNMKRLFGKIFDYLAIPNGCIECKNGFKGRVAIFELLLITDFVSKQIVQNKILIDFDQNYFWPFSKHACELFMQNKIYFNDLLQEF